MADVVDSGKGKSIMELPSESGVGRNVPTFNLTVLMLPPSDFAAEAARGARSGGQRIKFELGRRTQCSSVSSLRALLIRAGAAPSLVSANIVKAISGEFVMNTATISPSLTP